MDRAWRKGWSLGRSGAGKADYITYKHVKTNFRQVRRNPNPQMRFPLAFHFHMDVDFAPHYIASASRSTNPRLAREASPRQR